MARIFLQKKKTFEICFEICVFYIFCSLKPFEQLQNMYQNRIKQPPTIFTFLRLLAKQNFKRNSSDKQ